MALCAVSEFALVMDTETKGPEMEGRDVSRVAVSLFRHGGGSFALQL